jgi:transcriptional regulator with XRE-family HTH domain
MKNPNEFSLALAKVLRMIRTKKNLTMGQVEIIYNIPNTTIGNWENCRTSPSIEALYKLAKVYGVRMSFIMSAVENELARKKINDSQTETRS